METPVYPSTAPATQAEFTARDTKLVDDWFAVLRDGHPDTELRCYPAMLCEAKLLLSRCNPKKSESLREMVKTLTWALG